MTIGGASTIVRAMDFARLAEALGGELEWAERGKVREPASILLRGAVELRVYPELSEGECVGAVFVAARPHAAEMPRIVLRAEDALDRGAKRVGLTREAQLGDAEFDAAVYVESEAPEATIRAALAAPQVRAAAIALVRGPAGEVQLGEGRISARLDAAAIEGQAAALPALLAALRAMAEGLAVPKDMPSRAEIVGRRSVGHIVGIALAWLASLVAAVFVRPPLVLEWDATLAALGAGVALWLLVVAGLGLVLRGAPDSLRWLAITAVFFVFTTPIAGMRAALRANAALDDGAATQARREVTAVDASERHVLLDVAGLLPGEPRTRLAVPRDMVRGTLPKDPKTLELTLRPGRFGWTWVEEVRP